MYTKQIVLALVLAIAISSAPLVSGAEQASTNIQMAILLDTSNSMDGLIAQAKSQLWKIVNEFLYARKDGQIPRLQVALYEYGKSSLPSSEGFLRMISPFTDDLDLISQELFALTTNGGQEYCGHVIGAATAELEWSPSSDDLKVIFIAGNEGFDQGSVDFRTSCRSAIARGITVNTIFCGAFEGGVNSYWKDGATLADGSYMNIDPDRAIPQIVAPQDAEINRLGIAINRTYVPYGEEGKTKLERQSDQDKNALQTGTVNSVQRMVCKSSQNYNNVSWDLVDAVTQGRVKIEEIEEKDLPEELQKKSIEEKIAYVQVKAEERAKIQKKIQELNEGRRKYVQAEEKKLAETAKEASLDVAIGQCLKEQALKKNIEIK